MWRGSRGLLLLVGCFRRCLVCLVFALRGKCKLFKTRIAEESGMHIGTRSSLCGKLPWMQVVATTALVVIFLILSTSQRANALPAFARKYGLRCSACHESWPMLNYFGQKFKDNGYQLMNDRDAPIWQNPGYWPVTFRITPYLAPRKHRQGRDRHGSGVNTKSRHPASISAGWNFDRRHA